MADDHAAVDLDPPGLQAINKRAIVGTLATWVGLCIIPRLPVRKNEHNIPPLRLQRRCLADHNNCYDLYHWFVKPLTVAQGSNVKAWYTLTHITIPDTTYHLTHTNMLLTWKLSSNSWRWRLLGWWRGIWESCLKFHPDGWVERRQQEARSGVDASLFSVTSPGCSPPDELVSSMVILIHRREQQKGWPIPTKKGATEYN